MLKSKVNLNINSNNEPAYVLATCLWKQMNEMKNNITFQWKFPFIFDADGHIISHFLRDKQIIIPGCANSKTLLLHLNSLCIQSVQLNFFLIQYFSHTLIKSLKHRSNLCQNSQLECFALQLELLNLLT